MAAGLSCYKSNEGRVQALAEEIRRQSPGVRIVCGGPQATFADAALLRNCGAIDVCVRAYGEFTACELTEWMAGQRSLDSIAGITFRRNGEPMRTPDRRLPENLDVFPDPYLDGILPAEAASEVGVVTSRGCRFKCAFCGGIQRGAVAFHSAERVISVVRLLDGQVEGTRGPHLITVGDDNLGFDKSRLHALLERMAGENFRNLHFYAQMRTESLREETFPLLRKAGFTQICFGLESAVPRVLAAMRKVRAAGFEEDGFQKERDFLERIAWGVTMAGRVGLHTSVSIVLGFPGETEAEARQTLAFVDRLGCDGYSHNFFLPCPGSPAAALPPASDYVHRLPVLKHAENYDQLAHSTLRWVLRLLSDNWDQATVVGLLPEVPEPGWARLRAQLPLCSHVWTLDPGRGLNQVAFPFAPIPVTDRVECRLVGDASPAAFSDNLPAVHLRRLSEFPWPEVPEPVRQRWNTLLICIDERKDVAALQCLAEADRVWLLPAATAGALPCVRDACRWGSGPCPALSGKRWLANEHGHLLPCFAAEAGDYAALAEEVAERRGCGACPASDFCSRCLYPDPLTATEYCSLRRRTPRICAFVEGLTAARELMLRQRLRVPLLTCRIHSLQHVGEGTLDWDGRQVHLSSCLLVTNDGDGKAFLCSRRADLLIELDVEQARILQTLVHS